MTPDEARAFNDPIQAAMKSALSLSCEISESSAWLLAYRALQQLDAAGYKLVGTRTPALRESRTVSIDLATYQQILGERNALLVKVAELNGQLERYRDMVGEAEVDVMDLSSCGGLL